MEINCEVLKVDCFNDYNLVHKNKIGKLGNKFIFNLVKLINLGIQYNMIYKIYGLILLSQMNLS